MRWVLGVAVVCMGNAVLFAQDSEEEIFFEKKIRPILVDHCYKCHSKDSKSLKGGLLLDSRQGLRKGGDSGPALLPGNADGSLLLEALRYQSLEMPPSGKLPESVIGDFKVWITRGAYDPRDVELDKNSDAKTINWSESKQWWAFQPVKRYSVSKKSDMAWAKKKTDLFIFRKLQSKGLRPSIPATRRTLIRRASFDLTGLPPSFPQTESFVNSKDPDAYEILIDRLLASSHYGERWGRHWLDVARWAEDNPTSEATNPPYPDSWKYRDWVIQAINDDIPYDQFIRMQLAADLLPDFDRKDLPALGYIGTGPVYHKDPRLSRDVIETFASDDWDERVDAVSRGLLGLTVGCARCHDHKFDPISVQDYYALAGIFSSSWEVNRPLVDMAQDEEERLIWAQDRIPRLKLAIDLLGLPATPSTPEQIDALKRELESLEKTPYLDVPMARAVYDAGIWIDGSDPDFTWMDIRIGEARDLPIFIRGNVSNPGEIVPRRFLSVFSEGDDQKFDRGAGRLELANSILEKAGALAARVIVNRVWGWHFGNPLVRTPSNFGVQGEKPTHPELLDDLSARFVENRWSLKWLHREIMLSSAYQQSSSYHETAVAIDPDNKWLWRMTPRRLDFESWRDALLVVTDSLDTTFGGPSLELDMEDNFRRTVYAKVSRSQVNPLMRMYDFPDATEHSPSREITTTPLQQLFVLNSQFMVDRAEELAESVRSMKDSQAAIEFLFRKVLGISPDENQRELSQSFVQELNQSGTEDVWAVYCQALLGTNAFIFVE